MPSKGDYEEGRKLRKCWCLEPESNRHGLAANGF